MFILVKEDKEALEAKKNKAYIFALLAKVKKEKTKKVKYIINKGWVAYQKYSDTINSI